MSLIFVSTYYSLTAIVYLFILFTQYYFYKNLLERFHYSILGVRPIKKQLISQPGHYRAISKENHIQILNKERGVEERGVLREGRGEGEKGQEEVEGRESKEQEAGRGEVEKKRVAEAEDEQGRMFSKQCQ